MKSIYLKKVGRETFIPADQITAEHIESIQQDAIIEVKLMAEVRCPALHRKFFKMIAEAYKNIPEHLGQQSLEQFRKSVTVLSGYYNELFIPCEDGYYIVREPKSIAYSSMDEAEFQQLYKAAHQALCLHYDMGDFSDFVLDFM